MFDKCLNELIMTKEVLNSDDFKPTASNIVKYKELLNIFCRGIFSCPNNQVLDEPTINEVIEFINLSSKFDNSKENERTTNEAVIRFKRLKHLIKLEAPNLLIENERLILHKSFDKLSSSI